MQVEDGDDVHVEEDIPLQISALFTTSYCAINYY